MGVTKKNQDLKLESNQVVGDPLSQIHYPRHQQVNYLDGADVGMTVALTFCHQKKMNIIYNIIMLVCHFSGVLSIVMVPS